MSVCFACFLLVCNFVIVKINTFDDVGHSGSRDGGGGGEDTEADRGGGEGGDQERKVRMWTF